MSKERNNSKKNSNRRNDIIEGFFRIKKRKGSIVSTDQEINVSEDAWGEALDGDFVQAQIEKGQAKINKIIKRSRVGLAGVFTTEKDQHYVDPSNYKIKTKIKIEKDSTKKAKDGEKVFVVLTNWDGRQPIGAVKEILGEPHDNDTEMRSIAIERGFSAYFPKPVKEEIKEFKNFSIPKEERENRKDLTEITTFTIDPADAKDFDDAVSIEEKDNGDLQIGVHIADASYFVQPQTALDEEAIRRGTSVYLVDRTIPMLPEELSNDLCSLNPNENKLAFSAIFTTNKDGDQLKDKWFGRTIIKSKKRLTYAQAEELLENGNSDLAEKIKKLEKVTEKMCEKRFADGAISLSQDEVKFILDENGFPIDVEKKEQGRSNRLIEELMLLANKEVAKYISKKTEAKTAVYRIHPSPDPDRIDELNRFLAGFGYILKDQNGEVSRNQINKLIKKVEGKEEEQAVQTAIIRSMSKAVYSTQNVGHYGLGFEYYTHFTSPIRRYPDILVHRILDKCLKDDSISSKEWDRYERLSVLSSERERDAMEAERDSVKYKQVQYMSQRKGQIFNGVITGLNDWGMFIAEESSNSEGVAKLRDLKDDFYEFKEDEKILVGQKTKKKYKMGDTVKIKVKDTNLNKKTIDYELVK